MGDVFKWLWTDEFGKRQEDLNFRCAQNCGTWFFICEEFMNWISGEADLLVYMRIYI